MKNYNIPKGIIGIFPEIQMSDDIVVYETKNSEVVLNKFLTLRQQSKKPNGKPNIALSDFISPISNNQKDYIGCFCVTAGFGS